MTEKQWLEAADAKPMLEFIHVYRDYSAKEWQTNYGYPMPPLRALQDKTIYRQFTLFAMSCAMRNPVVTTRAHERAYEAIDEYAAVSAELEELVAAYGQLSEGTLNTKVRLYILAIWTSFACEEHRHRQSAEYVAEVDAEPAEDDRPFRSHIDRHSTESAVQVETVRELFGNPFRPVTIDPMWRTSDVMLLANGIYTERAFDRMPILADALQDAGCDSDDLLSHLRDPHATHVRGCWALDLVQGKQ